MEQRKYIIIGKNGFRSSPITLPDLIARARQGTIKVDTELEETDEYGKVRTMAAVDHPVLRKHLGAAVLATIDLPEVAKVKPESTVDKKRVATVTALAFGCVIVWGLLSLIPSPTDKRMAFQMSKQFVSDELKAPDTAKYPNSSQALIEELGDKKYRVTSYVTAQNVYGVPLKTTYTCTLHYAGQDKWICDDLKISEP